MDKTPLSILAFILGAGAGAQAQTTRPVDLKSLQILDEVKMTMDQYKQLMRDYPGVFHSDINDSNYDTMDSEITDGNYDTMNSEITDGNYDTMNSEITDGNYDTMNSELTDANYDADVDPHLKEKLMQMPTPSVNEGK
jgi:hypothetical protein